MRNAILTGFVVSTLLWADGAVAQLQPVADDTLGPEQSLVTPTEINGVPSDLITEGAQRGTNLFHSFQEFSIDEGRAAYFNNPDGVENIFGPDLIIRDGAQIAVQSEGAGDAGDVAIWAAGDVILSDHGSITSSGQSFNSIAGDIAISADGMIMLDNYASINSDTNGGRGNIHLATDCCC